MDMTKKLEGVFATFLLSTGAMAAEAPVSADRPNVLFIAVDDLRTNLGCYGDPVAKTPNIDRLAKMGTVFTHAYVQQAVCSASRASVLTGCRPDTTTVDYPYNKFFIDEFLPAHPSVPLYFSRNGYAAKTGGKIHHAFPYDLRDIGFGHDYWYRYWYYADDGKTRIPAPDFHPLAADKPSWNNIKDHGIDSDYVFFDNVVKECDNDKSTRPAAYECADVQDIDYRDGRIAEAAIAALGDVDGRAQPFFLAAGFNKPHLPFNAPKKYWDLYDPAAFKLPQGTRFLIDSNLVGLANASYELPAFAGGQIDLHDDTRLRQLTHGYYACVSFTDANVGKLIDALQASGQMDNTIVVFWSDHGFHLGENQSFGKHTVFEVATHSPLIIVAPGMKAGRRCDALVEYVDIFPTLCDLAGISEPGYLEGTSLKPLLENPQTPWKTAAFSQWPRNKSTEGYSIRTDRYRYTEWRESGKTGEGAIKVRELYDHQADPGESTNIAVQFPETVQELSQHLHKQFP
jgi:arylsulfatase A-like enzyme